MFVFTPRMRNSRNDRSIRWHASVKIRAPRRYLNQQRIVIRRQNRAGIRGTAIQPNPKSRRRAVSGNASVVRRKVLLRIFRCDAALQRGAVQRNLLLLRKRQRILMKLVPLRNQNLRAYDVNARHHFGNGVLNLNPRVHLDEIPFLRIHVVEEFHRSCVSVVGFPRDLHRRGAQFFAYFLRQIARRRHFHDFLVPPLHRAIAFIQMQEVAVLDRREFAPQCGAHAVDIFPEIRTHRRTPISLPLARLPSSP